ncbi:MAG: hypothetical protein KDB53_01720 [Planctomycetes bacterium]|nr:hypothetical protein [Planctomycetota bacterium]
MKGNPTIACALLGILCTGLLPSCAVRDGITENVNVAAATTPVVAEAQMARDQANTELANIMATTMALPVEVLFYGLPETPPGSEFDPNSQVLHTPETRQAYRRHAMGLPDHVDRRVEDRRAARRRMLQISSGQ